MNDFVKENNLVISENINQELALIALQPVTTIGIGKGSTTLFPSLLQFSELTGAFLDCAGEGDTGGVIAKAINAKIKSVISSNVEEAKLLFVASQNCLGSQGSYGESFKKSLEANAHFLNDINYFKDSIAFVVSHAARRANTHEIVKNLILTILKEHNNLELYKDAISNILEEEKDLPFSKISTFSVLNP
jgi:hypothetical protein